MTQIKSTIIAALLYTIVLGIFMDFIYPVKEALIIAIITGLFFVVFMYLFSTSKNIKNQTQINLYEGDKIIYEGDASHIENRVGFGGRLYLLTDKLQFKSHKYNTHNDELMIFLKDITRVSYFNTLGLVPNGLKIETTGNRTEKFVVNERKHWRDEIEKIKTTE